MENINLIRKIAWSFHYTTGLNWDDLFQEAALAYLEGLENYDPKKGKMATFMWHCMSNRLLNYIKEEADFNGWTLDIKEAQGMEHNEENFLDSLTEDARAIADIVLRTSKKFVVLEGEQAEARIVHILVRKGWPPMRIAKGILDLQYACLN